MSGNSLLLDRRAAFGGAGLHALLIGVSDYAHLTDAATGPPPEAGLAELQKLDCAATSAAEVARKLMSLDTAGRLHRPLKTLRLLLAPSAVETTSARVDPAWPTIAPTRAAIEVALWDWRIDARESPDGVALFYYSGHGIRRSLEEAILLGSDFLAPGKPQLANAFRLSEIHNGLATADSQPDIARNQFFFVDACRERPKALDQMDDTSTPKVWDVDLNGVDARSAPIYFSTPAGGSSGGAPGRPSYFAQALVWALDHGSYDREALPGIAGEVWPVRPKSLHDGLRLVDVGGNSRYELTGKVGDGVLSHAVNPPTLNVRIQVAPDASRQSVDEAFLSPLDGRRGIRIRDIGTMSPCVVQDVRAGLYRVTLRTTGRNPQRYRSAVKSVHVGLTMPWLHVLP